MATKNLGRVTGLSAYEIWINQGNTGTETEFLNSLKGVDGINGQDGTNGLDGNDGYSPTATITPTTNGAVIVITDKNGTTTTNITNGKNGIDGKDGATGTNGIDGVDGQDGYTPVRGIDYWTETDIAEIKKYVDEAILGGAW